MKKLVILLLPIICIIILSGCAGNDNRHFKWEHGSFNTSESFMPSLDAHTITGTITNLRNTDVRIEFRMFITRGLQTASGGDSQQRDVASRLEVMDLARGETAPISFEIHVPRPPSIIYLDWYRFEISII